MFSTIFNEILFRPLFNALILIYNFIPAHDFGLAIILLTILIRILLMPLSIKALVSQRNIAKIQPLLKEIQKKYKDNRQKQTEETMALYKQNGINPLSGCLPLLIQLPILWSLYQVFINGFKPASLMALYSFVRNPGAINTLALGFINLAQSSYYLAITAGVMQFIQSFLMNRIMPKGKSSGDMTDTLANMNRQMLYIFPVLIIIIAWKLPAGLTLYWVSATLFSIFEQLYLRRKHPQTPAV